MRPLSNNDIESELSYAWLHAVAAKAGMACREAKRLEDNAGIDATLVGWPAPQAPTDRHEVDLKVQLKATIAERKGSADHWHYPFKGIPQYNTMRSAQLSTPRILVVLYLPADAEQWLKISADELVLRQCAHWVSLRAAPDTASDTSVTIHLPKAQILDVPNLIALQQRLARADYPVYEAASND